MSSQTQSLPRPAKPPTLKPAQPAKLTAISDMKTNAITTAVSPDAPAPPHLRRRDDGQLLARRGDSADAPTGDDAAKAWVPVNVRRCFPWSRPDRFFSLRAEDDSEVALLPDLAALDPESRAALAGALAESGFVFAVRRLVAVREEFELRHWRVETAQGPRTFQTARDEWPREVPDGGLLLRDISGDLYHFPPPQELDPASRRILWAYIE